MPTAIEAWRAIYRFVAGTDATGTNDSDTRSTRNGPWRGDAPWTVRDDRRRLHPFFQGIRDWVLGAPRGNELALHDEMWNARRAKRRALTLLIRQLTPEQRQEFRDSGHFHVIGGRSGNRYRIRAAAFANIDLMGANGRVKCRLCAHPAGDVPVYDVMAAQLLHLQDPATEQRFLQEANVHPALSEDRIRSIAAWNP